MSPEQVAQVFAALGRIEQKVDGQRDWMKQHVEDDKLMADDIRKIQMHVSKQKGFITALTTIGSVAGAAIGYVVEKWMGAH